MMWATTRFHALHLEIQGPQNRGQTAYSTILELPFISNRDYVLSTTNSTSVGSDGQRTYKMEWNVANELAPPLPEDTVRRYQ